VIWLGPKTSRAVIDLNSEIIAASKGQREAEAKRKKWSEVPGWLAVTCDLVADAFRREEDYAACCCFVQNLSLALWSVGVGTKWSTGDVTRHPDFLKLLNIDPSQQRCVGLVWYGYPMVTPTQTRLPVESFLVETP
jgi:nitroreductase